VAKARLRKPDGRKSKSPADVRGTIVEAAESALPPKKPPAPSAKHRWRRAKLRKLK
jgi:hypothetical protein